MVKLILFRLEAAFDNNDKIETEEFVIKGNKDKLRFSHSVNLTYPT